jgi:hypothetical protein
MAAAAALAKIAKAVNRIDTSPELPAPKGGLGPAATLSVCPPQVSCTVSLCYVIRLADIKAIGQIIWGDALMNLKVVSLVAVTVAAFAAPAVAHHSFAMFDRDKTVTLEGMVKEFEWTNPHSWLRFTVNDEKSGKPIVWAVELSSPSRLITMGMHADSVKPGDAVSVTFHPMKDGSRGGQFIQAVLPGGKEVIRANARDENN